MISNPRVGQRVRLHYAKRAIPHFFHGRRGMVVVAGKGKPRNHLVKLDGSILVVVPCGNLMPEATCDRA